MQDILDYASFAPHGYCLLWDPRLIATHVVADLLIFLSYFAIPGALVLFLRQRPELKHRSLVALFAAFIALCGLTHLVSLATLWIPIYTVEGALKLATGIVSAATAVVLFRLVPKLVLIPSPDQLVEANARLQEEILAHQSTVSQLREAHHTLEKRVEQRTLALKSATEGLAILSREALHRSRNILTVVASIARQTARSTKSLETFQESFFGRISALNNATASVNETTSSSVLMRPLVERQLNPVLLTFGQRLRIEGPELELDSQAAQQIALVLHELSTNSLKHGVLSHPQGEAKVFWTVEDSADEPTFVLTWQEPDAPKQGGHLKGGFGSRLLLQIAPATLGGQAQASFADGFSYRLSLPLMRLRPSDRAADRAEGIAKKIVDDAWGAAPG